MNQICHIRCKYSWYFHPWSCSVRAAELTAVCWTISIILPLWPLWPNLCKLFWPSPGFPESFICNPFLIPTELSWHHDFSISHAALIFALIVLSLLHFYYLLHILRIQIPLLVLLTSCSSDLVSARTKLVWFCLITHFSLNNTVYIYNPLFSFSLVFWSFLPPFVLFWSTFSFPWASTFLSEPSFATLDPFSTLPMWLQLYFKIFFSLKILWISALPHAVYSICVLLGSEGI